EIALPLQRRGHRHVSRGVRHQLLLPLLAPEEVKLIPNVPFLNRYGAADGIAGVVVAEQGFGNWGQPELGPNVVQKGVGVESLVTMIQIARSVELRGAALGDQLDLCTCAAAIFGLIGAGEHLELRDRVVADAGVQAPIVTGVDIADSVESDLVLRG